MQNASANESHRKSFKAWYIIIGILAGLLIGAGIVSVLHELRLL
jgi:hypothetical protein